MSATSSPVESRLPHRSGTTRSSIGPDRRASMSDDEAIPGSDSNETTNLLLERLRAWKHLCGYLEDYVAVTAKVQKSQSKDYEKILKTVSDPLKEGHHFSPSAGGVSSWFENIRTNTQGMVNMYLESEKNLKGSITPTLERLHKEIKNKSKELQSGASKSSKAVEKARGVTQKHIELLAQHSASFDAAAGTKLDQHHDPYILRRGINHRLNKQVIEENNNRQDIIAVQNNFQQFEAHVLQTLQATMEQFVVFTNNQLDRHRTMYTDILGTAQRIPPDFEWVNFITQNDTSLVNPDAPPRSLSNITFPNQDHRATKPLIEGSLERKSRAVLKGYSTGHYVVTHARYLHEFKDNDDFRRDPTPELSLFLPDCIIGAIDGNKFSVKGKDVSSGKVGNAFHTNTELNFKATSPNEAEKWWTVIKDATRAPPLQTSMATPPAAMSSQPASPAVVMGDVTPPAYTEKTSEAAAHGPSASAQATQAAPSIIRADTAKSVQSTTSTGGVAPASEKM
ncbi:hypothetical protein EYZ11_001377 [Aspergillus tanneri]|uniref:PH domain-containing protein n=1 Tax=Aspergillus tanneri TaxID=1220188 RepID=A0A4S3JUQ8_9EURO|nr:uncharacterized protein ATNIH1004_008564 [Aspergillus tanneri]KAA8644363.1 hypothetical protein ATNIH1004_008564 [Aspergillus tanneri]THC99126.1 hypothetical protein EYZ11_001377 [Aspergillus tanneri]